MANYNQLNTIGSGPYFPIRLEYKRDKDGNIISDSIVVDPGTPDIPGKPGKPPVIEHKALVGWYPLYGDIRLIKQNITAILTYQIGQRFRQEDFGSRTWECLEEPNVSALNLMIKNFVKDGIAAWEPRIKALKVLALKPTKESIRLLIYFRVQNSQRVEELNFQYNLNNSTTNVY